MIKTKKPRSLYHLARLLGRDFKAVSKDVSLLEKFGFIDFHRGKTGKREAKVPVLAIDQLNIVVEF
jgi:predicted transcriptional regulator